MRFISSGLFIAGTDTNVGKTVVSACLVRALGADYWKPVQSGLSLANDSTTVMQLAGVSIDRIHPCTYSLQAPLSPHEAARREGIQIILDRFRLPQSVRPLMVEGSGGVLVPLNKHYLMIDLMARLGLPVILVANNRLGTINHTMLSLAALYNRRLLVRGVILNGCTNQTNYTTLKSYTQIPLIKLPYVDSVDATTVTTLARIFCDVLILRRDLMDSAEE